MKSPWIAAVLLSLASPAYADTTIVMIRHGEKPDGGLGQLNCPGLNRALKLPAVLTAKFGKPAAIFAPNPSAQKKDNGTNYNYIRPLATIEPTAITLGMPVNTRFGWLDIAGLRHAIENKNYTNATVFVAWEHDQLEALAKALL